MLSIFSCACWPPVCLRNIYSDLLPVFPLGCCFLLLLSCISCLYILEIKPLLAASFEIIFSHSVNCLLFLFLMVSFTVQKLLCLIRSHGFIFVFIAVALGDERWWESHIKKLAGGVPVVAQWFTNPTRNHEVMGSVPALAQWVKDRRCHELWCRSQTQVDLVLLWLCCRLSAVAPIRPLAWEPPYAAGAALKRQNNNNI